MPRNEMKSQGTSNEKEQWEVEFRAGMTATYDGHCYHILAVNLQEQLLGLIDSLERDNPNEHIFWVRRENATIQIPTSFGCTSMADERGY